MERDGPWCPSSLCGCSRSNFRERELFVRFSPNREAPLFAARVNFRGERIDKFLFLSVFFSSRREKRVEMIGYPARRRGNGRSALTLAFKVKRSCRYSIVKVYIVKLRYLLIYMNLFHLDYF